MGVGKCAQRFPERTGATDAKRRDGCPAGDDLVRSQYAYPKGVNRLIRWLMFNRRAEKGVEIDHDFSSEFDRARCIVHDLVSIITLNEGILRKAFEQYLHRSSRLNTPARRRCSSFTMSMIFLLHQKPCRSALPPPQNRAVAHDFFDSIACLSKISVGNGGEDDKGVSHGSVPIYVKDDMRHPLMVKRSQLAPIFSGAPLWFLLILLTACSSLPGSSGGNSIPTPGVGGSNNSTPASGNNNPGQTVPMPQTQTYYPATKTARAAVMRPLALGSHQNLVYIYNEVPHNTSTASGHLRRYDATNGQKTDVATSGIQILRAPVASDS